MSARTRWSRCVGLLLALASTASATACVDHCSGGLNMTSPRVRAEGEALVLEWDPGTERGADLPANYFYAPRLECVIDETRTDKGCVVTAVDHRRERELVLTVNPAVRVQAGPHLVRLVFPDRRQATGCRHGGMDDTYDLRVTLSFDAGGQLSGSKLDEHDFPGSY